MKKISFVLIFSMSLFALSAQTMTSANVQKYEGTPIFVYSEPTKDYEVVFKKEIKLVWDASSTSTIEKVIELLSNLCDKESKKENKPYDAIIVNGFTGTAIKFK